MNLLAFIGASVILTLMPGPDIIFVITLSITQGKKSGILTALGLVTGITSATELRMLTEIEDLSIVETNMYVA